MKTTTHWIIGFSFLIGATARSATITSIISYIDLADARPPMYPIQIVGSPAFGYGDPWYGYWGTIKVASDPNEEIFNLVLNFQKNADQRDVDREFNPYNGPIQGTFLGELINPEGSLQEWGVSWSTGYMDGRTYGQNERNLISLTGTVTLTVNSSIGEYPLLPTNTATLG